MTEDQKDKSLLLELLAATARVPRTATWLDAEMRLAGRPARDIPGLLLQLERAGLVATTEDALGVRRHHITEAGLRTLQQL